MNRLALSIDPPLPFPSFPTPHTHLKGIDMNDQYCYNAHEHENNYAEQKGFEKKEYCKAFVYLKFQEMQTNLKWPENRRGHEGWGREEGKVGHKGI